MEPAEIRFCHKDFSFGIRTHSDADLPSQVLANSVNKEERALFQYFITSVRVLA